MKLKIMTFISLTALLLVSACGTNKKVVVEPVPVRNPLMLAHEAAASGNEAYDEKLYTEAILSFNEAIALFNEASMTAVPSDSVELNIEKMNLNVAKSYIDLAVESGQASLFDEAVQNYEQALNIYKSLRPVKITQEELDANILGVYNNLAITSKNAGKYEQAINYYDQILKMQPNNPDYLNAKFFILSDNIKDEARAFAVLIEYADASKDPAAYINLGDRYFERGNTVEAGKYYEKALALKPDADMYRRMANFYRADKDWTKANVFLQKLVDTGISGTELATVYTMIGKNYEEMNNKKSMIEYYEKSLMTERDPQLALLVASYYNSQKSYSKVITYASITLNSDARNADALMLRGLAYYQTKNYAAAKSDLEKIQNDARWGTQAKNILKDKKMPK